MQHPVHGQRSDCLIANSFGVAGMPIDDAPQQAPDLVATGQGVDILELGKVAHERSAASCLS